ncbi:sugar transferase [Urbifossiella limnaea]|uniref:UDP-glucose:undecaprenyl-phosphate glucose-1-phosphate transferase n=1 Tax=Urbifossiella limnaea TaxID=2528023 RepID=A0A517XRC5_9BACT|nr:sugar transferase [Urbifossiella limnaea]QDU20066.1 UDP-glucose:undecaprenyl-phosphate glucose-1-phosphate transferase [Urbifossiella limnaea]
MSVTPTPPPTARDPWPEIDRLAGDIGVSVALCPTWYNAGKVVFDYAVALAALAPALLLICVAAVAVKLSSPGPVFYTQTRLGLRGRRYRIVKLRTMHHNVELKSGIKWAGKDDDRVFRVGKWLRRTHVDELPQLFNVLLGQMSLVGPRPERPEVIESKGLERLVPGYSARLLVKPGVTGLAQVQLPADSDITGVRHKVAYDVYYVRQQGLWLDLRLVLATGLKAAGLNPRLIRVSFLLPGRDAVAAEFGRVVHSAVLTPPLPA